MTLLARYTWRSRSLLPGVLLAACCTGVQATPADDLVLTEWLGRSWQNECVTFPLTPANSKAAERGYALLGAKGKEVQWQLVPGKTEQDSRICFQTDLPAYQGVTCRFSNRPAKRTTDLGIVQTDDMVCVTNRLTGLKLRRQLQGGQGPIAGVRLRSGPWTGDSYFSGTGELASWTVNVLAEGPVYAEIECRGIFNDKGKWALRFRIESGEPAIVVKEVMDAPAGGRFSLVLGGSGFQPGRMLSRDSRAENAEVRSDPAGNFTLEPWLHWNSGSRGNWVGWYDDAGRDLLMVGAFNPSVWVDPGWKGRAAAAAGNAGVGTRDGLPVVDLAVSGGRRAWLLGALNKAESVAVLGQSNRRVAPPPQQLLIKHGDFRLDRVKDFVLEWPGDDDNHPCLYIRKKDLPSLKQRLKSDPKELARWVSQQAIDKYLLDGPIRESIASGDKDLRRRMAEKADEYLQTCVDWYLKQDYLPCPGTAPHMQSLIITVANLIDPILGTRAYTDEARKRALAKLAFIGYVVSSADYWSPERGYTGFANMTSAVALYRTLMGCLLPSHPEAKAWADQGLGQLRRQVADWSDEDGGWVEAPHYAMVSFDHMLAGFTMAANAGLSQELYSPRMRKVIEWFAAISTPRDSRTGGFRHQPPIGNTYHGEPTGLYGLVAAQWKERDPGFAAQMQWLYEEHGRFQGLGIGWNFPSMLGYRFLMDSSGVRPQPAAFGSARFRNTGAVLRNTMQTDRETYLHLIAGGNRSHYDDDSGSIILYGKGRVLADDWGYIGRHPRQWHSLVSTGSTGGQMDLADFSTGPALDYVSGRSGAWQRQIALAKDPDPRGPTFFLLRDSLTAGEAATWRLWLTAAAVRVNGQGATVSGTEDVDMDIFIHEAPKRGLRTETASQAVSCGYRAGKEGPLENTQTALIATLGGPGALTMVLYPRIKSDPAPTVAWSADGCVATVSSAAGSDTVFLGPAGSSCESADGKVQFEGTAGAVQVRGGAAVLSLGAAGRVKAAGKELAGDHAMSQGSAARRSGKGGGDRR